jgi:Carboxypeptidase regulatory-like domain
MRLASTYCSLALLVTLTVPGVHVQGQTTTTGGLSGVVVDQTAAVVPDAAVEIEDIAKGTVQSAKTGRNGAYHFSFLRPDLTSSR